MKKIIFFFLATIILDVPSVSAFVFSPLDERDPWIAMDKLGHGTEHAIFASWFYLSDKKEWSPREYWQTATYAFLSSVAIGASYETVTGFFPKSIDGFSRRDFVWDVGGSAFGTGLTLLAAKNGSQWVRKVTLEYRKNPWLRFGANALVCGLNYALERTTQPERVITDENLFWFASLSILAPEISLDINQLLFFEKKNNIYWKNLAFDTFGGLVGVIIAKQFARFNPEAAKENNWFWGLLDF